MGWMNTLRVPHSPTKGFFPLAPPHAESAPTVRIPTSIDALPKRSQIETASNRAFLMEAFSDEGVPFRANANSPTAEPSLIAPVAQSVLDVYLEDLIEVMYHIWQYMMRADSIEAAHKRENTSVY
jgi:hypothetical protein